MRGGSKHPRAGPAAYVARQSPFRFLPAVASPASLPPEPIGIADMASMFSVTHRTLHFYEEKGLISADRVGLMRVYSHRAVTCMTIINTCREVGIPIAVIQQLMTSLHDAETQDDADAKFRKALLMRQHEMVVELSTLRQQMQQIGLLLHLSDDDDDDETAPFSNDNADPATLSKLELKCLSLMAEGYTPLRLARVLELPGPEIERLESGIIRKLNAQNRFQAVVKAVLRGIIQA